mmetsp:Transcript_12102/g.34651  ORF Transcript_12102/g.34651 Transcript_12102/m.34651 type:complete len:208 (+) Transcript_12102:317-940(+)
MRRPQWSRRCERRRACNATQQQASTRTSAGRRPRRSGSGRCDRPSQFRMALRGPPAPTAESRPQRTSARSAFERRSGGLPSRLSNLRPKRMREDRLKLTITRKMARTRPWRRWTGRRTSWRPIGRPSRRPRGCRGAKRAARRQARRPSRRRRRTRMACLCGRKMATRRLKPPRRPRMRSTAMSVRPPSGSSSPDMVSERSMSGDDGG